MSKTTRHKSCPVLAVERLEDRTVLSFLAPDSYLSPGGHVGTGDFNHDGHADLVSTHAIDGIGSGVRMRLGNGDGTFGAAILSEYPSSGYSSHGDFDRDGRLDAVINRGTSLSVMLGNGDGTFRAPATATAIPKGHGAGASEVGDLNNDGKLDVLAGASLLLGRGDGTLASPIAVSSGGPTAAGDFNADGLLDFVAASGKRLGLYLGNGDGTFQPPRTYSLSAQPGDIAVADFNRDGLLDVVTSNYEAGTLSVLIASAGSFQPARDFQAGPSFPENLVTDDFDHDGDPDLAVIGGSYLWVYRNSGSW